MEPHPRDNPIARWGPNVAAARQSLDLTQRQLGERAEASLKHISEIELGKVKPSIDMQVRLAEALGRGVTDLFPRTDDEAELAVRCSGAH